MMKLCGLQKTTLLDYPEHIAATIFSGGCNFRCPFCHNSEMLGPDAPETLTMEEFITFLRKRRHVLEGVCITGGEPTLSSDLESLIMDIRSLDLLVKLDTNGSRPDVLNYLCSKHLLDYVAMDIKAARHHYAAAVGIPSFDIRTIEESVAFLLEDHVPYEFRTTAVKGIHDQEDFRQIGLWLAGASRYYLQNYQPSDLVLMPDHLESFSAEELESFLSLIRPYVKKAELRGTD